MSNQIKKHIESISFGVLSAEEIRNMSVCEITSSKLKGDGTVYDDRMGAITDKCSSSCENLERCTGCCRTCGKDTDICPGHFGHIELNQNIIHPLYYKMVLSFLRCFCTRCNRLVITKEQIELYNLKNLQVEIRLEKILGKIEKIDICCHCEKVQPNITHSTTDNTFVKKYKNDQDNKTVVVDVFTMDEICRLFENIPDEDVSLLGFNTKYVHPKNLIMSVLPVLPSCARPFIVADGNICDDDLTNQYIEIIKINNQLGKNTLTDKDVQKFIQSLKFRIHTLFDNSKGKAKHTTNQRPIKGIKERLSGKDGQIRANIMGRRVNQSSRTVISPDPTMKIDQLGIPNEVADILTYPEHVNRYNVEKINALVNSGGANSVINNNGKKINLQYAMYKKGTELLYGDIIIRDGKRIPFKYQSKFELKEGDQIERNGSLLEDIKLPQKRGYNVEIGNTVHRKLQDDDVVLLNRQPTLHKGSMMAFRIKRLPGKTFRFNLAGTASFNSDFDGKALGCMFQLPSTGSVKSVLLPSKYSYTF